MTRCKTLAGCAWSSAESQQCGVMIKLGEDRRGAQACPKSNGYFSIFTNNFKKTKRKKKERKREKEALQLEMKKNKSDRL